ncbi:MAG: adenylosuccinate lyase [Sulfolobales archaeon]
MSICPLEFRYGSNEMREVFSRENIIRKMLEVELALSKALEEVGIVPRGNYEKLLKCIYEVRPEDVDKYEKVVGHDIVALLTAVREVCGESSNYLHYGATSNDIIDTAWSLLMRDAFKIVKKKLIVNIQILIELTRKFKDLVMVGRTHAQHALPITLGFKLANYVYEFIRSLERINSVEDRVIRGKMSGAVGTMAGWRGKGLEIENAVMSELNLHPHLITTQVVPRDGFAEVVSVLAILASQAERLGIEIRELMRPEILELAEGSAGRIGSSTMPHKTNPVECEKISGLARVLRGLLIPALENIPLWHERDLSNSSAERVLIPHSFILIDEILDTLHDVLKGLKVFPENMERNLRMSRGAIMAESLMLRLTDKGLSRLEAHKLTMELVQRARSKHTSLLEEAINDARVLTYLNIAEINEALDYNKYLGNYRELIDRTLKYAEELVEKVLHEASK